MLTQSELLEAKCQHLEAACRTPKSAPTWRWSKAGQLTDGKIAKTFNFQNYYETLAFINAIAYVIHAEDHHPELVVTYNRCVVKFDTHSVNGGKGGISENDFICAAKVDAIFTQSFA